MNWDQASLTNVAFRCAPRQREALQRKALRWVAGLLVLGYGLGLPCKLAYAHAVGLSRGDYYGTERGLTAVWTFAATELGDALAAPSRLHEWAVVQSAGQSCAGNIADVTQLEADGVAVRVEYVCEKAGDSEGAASPSSGAPEVATLDVDLAPLFAHLPHGHRHHVTHRDESPRILASTHPRFAVTPRLPRATSANDAPSTFTHGGSSGLGFVGMGFEHILVGFDHLLLLLMLVVVPLSWRRLVGVVTAFTCAHSLSLAWAVSSAWTPPSHWVEPAIAATLVWLGVENLRPSAQLPRLGVSFGFGLIHGLGFAGALLELGLSGTASLLPLLQFNFGVEAGQLLVLAAFIPVIGLAKRWRCERWLVATASVAVCVVGAVWFVERLAG